MAEGGCGEGKAGRRAYLTSREALRILRDEIKQVLDESQTQYMGTEYNKSILQRQAFIFGLFLVGFTTLFNLQVRNWGNVDQQKIGKHLRRNLV